jgi:hypothetical protein
VAELVRLRKTASIPEPVSGPGRHQGADGRAWLLAVVAATVAWSLWELRTTVLPAQYADDSALHEQMVRFATASLRAGRDPLTSWFPYLNLGSPQFLHYQSTPAILTGLAGLAVGPDTAFRWSLYLLWCLWPVAIYGSARVFGLSPPAAALAAAVAPLLHSVPGIGYEQHAYLRSGFGVWTQLWGSWALPFAWALTWRAMSDRRFIAPAAGLVALTAAFHYETGYLAFGAVVVLPWCVRADLRARLMRAGVLLVASLLASAWVTVPLVAYSRWAAVNQALAGGPSVNGYGARTVLRWLVSGRVFDAGHLPVVTLLAAAGLVVAVAGWRRAGPERALVALFVACLLLAFGRTTFGDAVAIIPGSTDVFFRRFMMGAQLAGIYLAGTGAAAAVSHGRRLAGVCADALASSRLAWLSWAPATLAGLAAVLYLTPAWAYLDSFDALNAAGIHAQLAAQHADAPEIAALSSYLRRHGGGRVFAGSPADGGRYFTIGSVPMYKYLASLDTDEVGNTLRTASLMSQPEYLFDEANPGDYPLFGIRYVLLPARPARARLPLPPGAVRVLRDRLFVLYELPAGSYLRVGSTVGVVTASRADIGSQTLPYLESPLPGRAEYLTVAYPGGRGNLAPLASPRQAGTAGSVLAEHADLVDGTASAVVRLRRRAIVVLSASFDPGWSATIDGKPATVQMVTPALLAVAVPPGTHRVVYRYTGFGWYPQLLALAAADLAIIATLTGKRRRQRRTPATPNEIPR